MSTCRDGNGMDSSAVGGMYCAEQGSIGLKAEYCTSILRGVGVRLIKGGIRASNVKGTLSRKGSAEWTPNCSSAWQRSYG